MADIIRYGFGQSSLGPFLAAASEQGLVAFEFGERWSALIDGLHLRIPDAAVKEDDAGMSDLIGQLAEVADHPERDPALVLDPRGSDYEQQVWDLLRQIPSGQTTTYGALAARMGTPRDARDVTGALAANMIAILIPCHRVVKKDGSLSGYRWGYWRKRALLSRERKALALQQGSRP